MGQTSWHETEALAIPLNRRMNDPCLTRLLVALATAAGRLLAVEPLNDTILHSAIPSPRGLRAVEIDLVPLAAPGIVACRLGFCPIADAWVLDGEDPIAVAFTDAVVEVWFVPERIVPKYGELAITLGLLEAGHAVAEVQHLLTSGLGENDAPVVLPPAETAGLRVRLAVIPFRLEHRITIASTDLVMVRVPTGQLDEVAQQYVDRVRAAQNDAYNHSVVYPPLLPSSKPLPNAAVRSSGHHPNGVWARPIDTAALFARIAVAWPTITAAANWGEALVEPIFMLRDMHGWRRRFDGVEAQDAWPIDESAIRRAFGGGFDYNSASLSAMLVLRADLRPAVTGADPNRYARALQAAGASAQLFCRAAAAEGVFARPLRGFDELALEVMFGGPSQMLYVVVVGGQRASLVRLGLS